MCDIVKKFSRGAIQKNEMMEEKMKRKKLLASILSVVLLFSTSMNVLAADSLSVETEQLTIEEALADESIVEYLVEHDELEEVYQLQDELEEAQYNRSAAYLREVFDVPDVSSEDVEELSEKYDLQLPNENVEGTIDNGIINVQRNKSGDVTDLWGIYYIITDKSFTIRIQFVNANNRLDSIEGEVTYYYLYNSTWIKKDSKPIEEKMVGNGVLFRWDIDKWGVKEKFEYELKVKDEGGKFEFDNIGKDNYTRYNFEAKPYSGFKANGGERHHFVPKKALSDNGFNSNTAYCIRMMTEDHRKTGSYGSSTYVKKQSDLLSQKKYEKALQNEVADMKSKMECEGIAGSLQQKYYNEILVCLLEYEKLFGIN